MPNDSSLQSRLTPSGLPSLAIELGQAITHFDDLRKRQDAISNELERLQREQVDIERSMAQEKNAISILTSLIQRIV